MPAMVDTTDVPYAAPEALALPMRYLVESSRSLALLKGLSPKELRDVDAAVWDDLAPDQRVVVLLRLRCLIRVFEARRLADLFLNYGHGLIAPAVYVAARMRLNTKLGFNPFKFERALRGLLAQMDDRHAGDMPMALSA
jgi:hypothetical protein